MAGATLSDVYWRVQTVAHTPIHADTLMHYMVESATNSLSNWC